MSRLLHKSVNGTPVKVVGGHGIYLCTADGRELVDTASGVAVSCLGHGHPNVVAAIKAQADVLSYAHAGSFTTDVAEELGDFLVSRSPGQDCAYFLSGGSETMELCLKTAYQYHVERGHPERIRFVSRRQNYHGSTLGTLAVTGNPQRRSVFDPILAPSSFVSPCYAYRGMLPGEDERAYGERLAHELEDAIVRLGPETVAGFVAETVVGSTSGAVPPVEGYLRAVREVCDRYGALLILDEVMAGMGRTGHLFACAEDGVEPDIIAIGKGLAAGYQPLSAMLVSRRVRDAIASGSGVLRNGQTFVNHPLACAAGLAVQRTIEEDHLLDNVLARGEQLRTRLRAELAEHPYVGDIRGRGLFVGVELVADRVTKEPLPVEPDPAAAIRELALAQGLVTYPMTGTIDGAQGAHVLLAPPYICTEDDIERIVEGLAAAMRGLLPTARRDLATAR
ncbi:MAG: aspartate aminotransferase family protein [Frankiaceae bacterium]